MGKATPGPWEVEPSTDGRPYIRADGYTIAKTYREARKLNAPTLSIPGEANARLIAAATDLLAACKNAELIMTMVAPRSDTKEYMACLEQIRKAITAAEQGKVVS